MLIGEAYGPRIPFRLQDDKRAPRLATRSPPSISFPWQVYRALELAENAWYTNLSQAKWVRIEQFCCRLQALVVSTYPVAFWIFQWGIVSALYLLVVQNITGNPGSPDWTDFGHLLVASRCPEYPQPGVYVGMLDMQNQRIAKKKVSVENVATQKNVRFFTENPHVRKIVRGRF